MTAVRDHGRQQVITAQGRTPLMGPQGDLLVLEFNGQGCSLAVRPSGTEPKLKFYLFAFQPPELIANLDDTQAELAARLARLEAGLAELAAG